MNIEEIRKGAPSGATDWNTCVKRYTKRGGHLLKDWLFWNYNGWNPLPKAYSGFNNPLY